MIIDKASSAVSESIKFLERALEALINDDYESYRRNVWLASSNAEYASFLLARMLNEKPSLDLEKHGDDKSSADDLLGYSFAMLNEALKNVKEGKLKEAYRLVKAVRRALVRQLKVVEEKRKSQKPSS
ncbi:MAG: hypothetical protein QXL67_03700 [Candidatus Bathyarchaeia archaeon]